MVCNKKRPVRLQEVEAFKASYLSCTIKFKSTINRMQSNYNIKACLLRSYALLNMKTMDL